MADFEKFYPLLAPFEGGYLSEKMAAANKDKGGETYKGIARNFNQDWEGWAIIDEYKKKNGIPKWNSYIKNSKLDALVKERAKKNYWDAIKASQIKNQTVADTIADYTFNSGQGNSIKTVQKILKLKQDGAVGPLTLKAINEANPVSLIKAITEERVKKLQKTDFSQKEKDALINRAKQFLSENKTPISIFVVLLIMGFVLYSSYKSESA